MLCKSLSEPVWAYLYLFGPIRVYLGLSGPIWAYLGLSGPIWAYLGLFESHWKTPPGLARLGLLPEWTGWTGAACASLNCSYIFLGCLAGLARLELLPD